ncbi:MAG: anti-sigma factor antagonist [Oscillospiraceae bacterium]|jgi:stage II sporulation protein AA (anti-sigma F factor antagonist)
MKILSSYKNGRLTLYFKGELDHHSAKKAIDTIDQLIDEYLPRDCVMELSGLTFMDSSGIAVILRVYKRMNEMGGRAWAENPRRQPMRVIDASGIDRIVKISTTMKE